MKRYRNKSLRHRVLESYYYRTKLSHGDYRNLVDEIQGYRGELEYDVVMSELRADFLLVNDLMVPYGKSQFQVDGLVGYGDTIIHHEVKNYTGTYVMGGEECVSEQGHRIDLYSQISSVNTRLYNLARRWGYRIKIISYTIFIHPEFQINGLDNDGRIVFAHQFPAHVRELLNNPLEPSTQVKGFLERLMDIDNLEYRPPDMPYYTDTRPGILCPHCHSFEKTGTRQTWGCGKCGFEEKVLDAIGRTVMEYHEMDPGVPITTQNAFHWCGGQFDKQQVRRALKKHFNQLENGRGTTYVRRLRSN